MKPHMSSPHPPRLKRRREFLAVAAKGRRLTTPGVVVQALVRAKAEAPRVGYTVTRKVGNAVVRNRARRRLREAARIALRREAPTGADLVMVGRSGTIGRSFELLVADMVHALGRLLPRAPDGVPR